MKKTNLIFIVLFLFFTINGFSQPDFYVDSAAAGTQNGTSWANAFVTLQDALTASSSGDVIWVANGTYYPDEGAGQTDNTLSSTFFIKSGVKVYGGFAGTETQLNQRDITGNKAILNGDIDGDQSFSGNAYHVVKFDRASDQTVLDGFVITGGYANGDAFLHDEDGGGIFNINGGSGLTSSNPKISNCIITGNMAKMNGGGIYNSSTTYDTCFAKIINCLISGNKAAFGGGIYNVATQGYCKPEIINCIIAGNNTGGFGYGAIYNSGHDGTCCPSIVNSIIWNNHHNSTWGQIYNYNSNCLISYCNIEHSGGSSNWNTNFGTDDGNNIEATPYFVDAISYTQAPFTNGDFHVFNGSPCINSGNNSIVTETYDLDGETRIQNTTVDMGPYEGGETVIAPGIQSDSILSKTSEKRVTISWQRGNGDFVALFMRQGNSGTPAPVNNTTYTSSTTFGTGSQIGSTGWYCIYNGTGTGITINGLSPLTTYRVMACEYNGLPGYEKYFTTTNIQNPVNTTTTNITRYYVKASVSEGGAGNEWAVAYKYLQNAIHDAGTGDTIWVAKGTYYPDQGDGLTGDDRYESFVIDKDIEIYGGFNGDEQLISERIPLSNTSYLDGDIDKNGNKDNNAYHVVKFSGVSSQCLFDGFTVQGGNASHTGTDIHKYGAGIYFDGAGFGNTCNPVVSNCIIRENYTYSSGGRGAGMYFYGADGTCNARAINCKIIGNDAGNGGGVYVNDCDPVFINCVMSGNDASAGGGVYNHPESGSCAPQYINCNIVGNNASSGSAVYNHKGSGTCSPEFKNTIIYYNSGINKINNYLGPTPTYAYCNISGSGGSGTGWNPDVGTDGGNNIDSIPLFNHVPNFVQAPVTNGDLRLISGSPCINTGNNDYITVTYDLLFETRIQESIADMGAYEGETTQPVIYVDSAATGNNDGTSWDDAFTKLKDALKNATSGTQIWVAKGTYYPDEGQGITDDNRTSYFSIPNGTDVYGGFSGTETSLEQRQQYTPITVLSGDIDQSNDTAGNAYHVIAIDNPFIKTTIDGFIIQDGNANGSVTETNRGGGIYNDMFDVLEAPVTISNCIIQENNAKSMGGGIYNYGNSKTSPSIVNCAIKGNTGRYGGGVYNNTNTKIKNCLISGNQAEDGGGIYNSISTETNLKVVNTTLSANHATSNGSAISIFEMSPSFAKTYIINSIIRGNTIAPGAVYFTPFGGIPEYTHCNVMGSGGSAAWNTDFGTDNGFNIDMNPLFYHTPDTNSIPTIAGDFHLQSNSPCINKGVNDSISLLFDLDNKERVMNDTIDMGCYETDDVAPLGHTITIDQAYINSQNQENISFLISGGELGTVCMYDFEDASGKSVRDSVPVSNASQRVQPINLSGLDEGSIYVSIYLKDTMNNMSTLFLDTLSKDTRVPELYSVSIDQDTITAFNSHDFSFTFSNAEITSTYVFEFSAYAIDTIIRDSGIISQANQQITGIDISPLGNNPVMLKATLTDTLYNVGDTVNDYLAFRLKIQTDSVISCYAYSNGMVTALAEYGVPPYNYQWDTDTMSTVATISGLPANRMFHVTVTDSRSNTEQDSILLNEPDSLAIMANYPGQAICWKHTVGYIDIDITGGTQPYNYYWSNGENTCDLSGVKAGNYTVTINDSMNCTAFGTYFIDSLLPYSQEEICMLTIDELTGKNMIVWEKTPDYGTAGYTVYKEGNQSGQYDSIGYIPFDSVTVWIDHTSIPEQQQDLYKISVVDSCGNESAKSLYHKPIFLQFSNGQLAWQEYEIEGGSDIGFVSYIIYRGADSTALIPIDTVSSSKTVYNDTSGIAQNNVFYYRVAGVRNESCYTDAKLKTSGGPYSRSISNLEDNRLKQENIPGHDIAKEINLTIHPNPYQEYVNIEYTLKTPVDINIEVLNMLGKNIDIIVDEFQQNGSYTYSFGDGYAKGMYHVVVKYNDVNIVKKVVRME